MRGLFYFLLISTIVLSCSGQKKMASKEGAGNGERLTLIAQDNYSGADSTETMVITSQKALKAFYARVNRTRKPGLPVPEIDFSKNMVVVLCSSDEVHDLNYGLSILKETDGEMVLGKPETSGNGRSSSSSDPAKLVSPFFVYKMPLTEKEISFKKIQ